VSLCIHDRKRSRCRFCKRDANCEHGIKRNLCRTCTLLDAALVIQKKVLSDKVAAAATTNQLPYTPNPTTVFPIDQLFPSSRKKPRVRKMTSLLAQDISIQVCVHNKKYGQCDLCASAGNHVFAFSEHVNFVFSQDESDNAKKTDIVANPFDSKCALFRLPEDENPWRIAQAVEAQARALLDVSTDHGALMPFDLMLY